MENTEITVAEFVDDSAEFFAPATTDMVDGLISQYQHARGQISEIAQFMAARLDGGAIAYFLDGNRSEDRGRMALDLSARQLFDEVGAVRALNAAYWSKALALTDVLDAMPQKRRDEWNEQIRQLKAPDFDEATVRNTLMDLLNMRSQFLAERVDGIFRGLSGEHVTNAPEAFGKRMIVGYVLNDYWSVSSSKAGLINDLRAVIAKFMGRGEPSYRATEPLLRTLKGRWGEWVSVDGGALRVRLYKKGTAHLEVHPDMAWRLNCVLAQLHPLAIPAEFRAKPKRKAKDVELLKRPLPWQVISLLASMKEATRQIPKEERRDYRDMGIRSIHNSRAFESSKRDDARREAEAVLEAIGGALQPEGYWQFDYDPSEVFSEILVSGCIPDDKSHQFYPTPKALAERVVEWANIGPTDTVLEPSAGQGGLADLLPKDRTICVEIAALNAKVLEAKGHSVVRGDFLTTGVNVISDCIGRFNRIVMNPPFNAGRWRAHLEHAADMLKPGGRLVAILPSGARNSGVLADGFDLQWHGPISNAFPGVSVDVVVLVADRQPW